MMQITKDSIILTAPDDLHLHLRQGAALTGYAKDSAASFARAMIMPNTLPPIADAQTMANYRDEILAATAGMSFTPLMTFKILPGMNPAELVALKEAGAIAGKYYPQGATTNAEDGCKDMSELAELFQEMERLDLVLSIHGEDPDAPMLEREAAFLPQLEALVQDFTTLKIVLEHVSSVAAVELVKRLPENVAGSITAHHLVLTVDDVLGQPHNLCMPVAKFEADRTAIRAAATGGSRKFFFGSDSAPHPRANKECAKAACGLYSAPVILPTLVEVFEAEGALERLESFTSHFGADFYGLHHNPGTITLTRTPWTVPAETHGVVPFRAGEELAWRVSE
ncbi:MAG: dihydroorotase [Planctomycetota bacterium]|jgi:dihydroorotase